MVHHNLLSTTLAALLLTLNSPTILAQQAPDSGVNTWWSTANPSFPTTSNHIWGGNPPHESFTGSLPTAIYPTGTWPTSWPSSWSTNWPSDWPSSWSTNWPTTWPTSWPTNMPTTAGPYCSPPFGRNASLPWGHLPPTGSWTTGPWTGWWGGGMGPGMGNGTGPCPPGNWTGWTSGPWSTAPPWTSWTACAASTTATSIVTTSLSGVGEVTYTSYGLKVAQAVVSTTMDVSVTTSDSALGGASGSVYVTPSPSGSAQGVTTITSTSSSSGGGAAATAVVRSVWVAAAAVGAGVAGVAVLL